MRLTKKKAIVECKALWKEIEESGLSKNDFLDSPAGERWESKGYEANCPLCEYVGENDCEEKCPLYLQYGEMCMDLGFTLKSGIAELRFFEAVRGLK